MRIMCFKLSSDTRFFNILIIIILQNKHLNDSYMILYIWTIKFVDDPIVGKLGLKWLSFKILMMVRSKQNVLWVYDMHISSRCCCKDVVLLTYKNFTSLRESNLLLYRSIQLKTKTSLVGTTILITRKNL